MHTLLYIDHFAFVFLFLTFVVNNTCITSSSSLFPGISVFFYCYIFYVLLTHMTLIDGYFIQLHAFVTDLMFDASTLCLLVVIVVVVVVVVC